uniref:NudC domain-containing protein 1 n=1 Tax=Saccoglossus kowalevskii TaxID=10224 RepID=A0ABM0GS54_SACKO|nr:PREDICTED: nudC domain-containing protein 1-like [Saccoglossus kowalevskii]
MATCTETFRVDRDQLDANFDGYKLSLDPLPVYSVNVDSGVDEVKLQENQYSLQHVRAFGVHNYLLLDQWNPNSVFYVDDQWKVMQLRVVLESQLSPAESVFQIPATNHKSASNRHFVTFHFPGPHWALLADGAGTLYILETGNRDQVSAPEWKIIYSESLCGSERPFVILDATLHISDSATTVDCLLLYIEEEKTDTMLSSSHFTSVIEWITITRQPETPHFQVERKRKLHSKAAPQFAALEPSGYAVHISADYDFNIVEDSLKPVEKKETPKPLEKSDTIYSWTQTLEDVTVTFVLPDGTNKSDIDIKLSCKDISIGIKNSFTLLQGILHAKIDVDVSTWTVEKRKSARAFFSKSGPRNQNTTI